MTQSALNPTPPVRAALALELRPGSAAGSDALAQEQAGELGALIAADLAGFAAEATALDLVLVGAHYDPVELLRPGWPLHHELEQLSARAPGERGGRVIAFGAHQGRLPGALAPSPEHRGGPLRLLPLTLTGDPAVLAAVGAALEDDLMERGMAGAATALLAQETFGLQLEHVRYLTLHDLCAMTALQYEHAGLKPLWPLLETALLAPGDEAWLDAPPEPLLHYAGGEARIALFSPDGWRNRYAPGEGDEARLERGFARFEARQRQLSALLQAHGVPVTYAHCRSRLDPHDELA
ncbi:hypothetical protein QFW77_09940 [Luteimonas sp. RD2P54]|uniref:Uncharacterized protein n=1 Tax=Luteimonas endophytica TaxID=3042023 RepID=A0ABT6JAV0_9GAMM|nr:hypothetical protein [Luteimonas endophytica]MDH5823303.1 hypothetical protein [Luteimonas endophytica]